MALQMPDDRPELTKNRVEALADGVFAIAMTILVFSIRVPELPAGSEHGELWRRLVDLWPRLHIYLVSFLILGVFWIVHDAQFRLIRHSDRVLLWINIIFLMFVVLIPFTTDLLGRYHTHRTAIIIYAGNMVAVALLLYLHWWYAVRNKQLTGDIDSATVKLISRGVLSAAAISMLAVGVSFIAPEYSKYVFLLVPILYALTRIAYRHERAKAAP